MGDEMRADGELMKKGIERSTILQVFMLSFPA